MSLDTALDVEQSPTFVETWKEMEKLLDTGTIHSLFLHHDSLSANVYFLRESQVYRCFELFYQASRDLARSRQGCTRHQPSRSTPILPIVRVAKVLRVEEHLADRVLTSWY